MQVRDDPDERDSGGTAPPMAGRPPGRADAGLAWLSGLVAFGLAATMLAISYKILRDYAQAHEYSGWVSWAWPTGLDGLMVVASLAVLDAARRGRRDWYALTLVGVGIGASLAFNVAHATTTAGRFAAVVPPTTAALALELFLRRFAQQRAREQYLAEPRTEPAAAFVPVDTTGTNAIVPAQRGFVPTEQTAQAAEQTRPVEQTGDAAVERSPTSAPPAGADTSTARVPGTPADSPARDVRSTREQTSRPMNRPVGGSVAPAHTPAAGPASPGRATYGGQETAKARVLRILEDAAQEQTDGTITASDIADQVGCSVRYATRIAEEWNRSRQDDIARLTEQIRAARAAHDELAAYRATHELATRHGAAALAAAQES